MTAQHKGNQSEESYLKNQSPNCPRFQENINTCSSTSVTHYNNNPRIGINPDNTFPERGPRLCRRKYCLRVPSGDVDFTGIYQLPTSSAEVTRASILTDAGQRRYSDLQREDSSRRDNSAPHISFSYTTSISIS